MPDWISPEAAKHWTKVALQLTRAGILTEIDATALALYCEAFARWKAATDRVLADGPVVTARSGFPVQSPYLAIANKAFDQMRRMLVEFGMTPSSRTRVAAVNQDDQEDDFAEFTAH